MRHLIVSKQGQEYITVSLNGVKNCYMRISHENVSVNLYGVDLQSACSLLVSNCCNVQAWQLDLVASTFKQAFLTVTTLLQIGVCTLCGLCLVGS